jgi:hypothetical protein
LVVVVLALVLEELHMPWAEAEWRWWVDTLVGLC